MHLHDVSDLPVWVLASIPVVLFVGHFVASGIRNLYFHPLSKIPGPKLAAFTQHYFTYIWLSGRYPFIIKSLHDTYGPVVRVSPVSVSFNSAKSWKDIYGHYAGRKTFLKSDFYDSDGREPRNIVSSRDPAEHGQMRKLLSHAFSAKALTEQEDIVHLYVDLLVKKIEEHATNKPQGEDMVAWYNRCTFDIIGDLAFGDPFGSLEKAETHFWISLILDGIKSGTYQIALIKYLANSKIRMWIKRKIIPRELIEKRQKHLNYSHDKIVKRMNNLTAGKDFLSKILSEKEIQNISVSTLRGHASVLIVAGSETTATFLSGVTYFLCRTPHAYRRLVDEVRSTFAEYTDINNITTQHCKYLNAVIEEGLRVYPPTPIGFPRISPGETVDGVNIPAGFDVFTSSWAATHSTDNFHRPYEFLPERWIEENSDKKEASQPFSLGSRVCLGRNLAYVEMRIILAKILWTYDMKLMDDKLDWIRDNEVHILWRKPALPVNFTRREGVAVPPLDG